MLRRAGVFASATALVAVTGTGLAAAAPTFSTAPKTTVDINGAKLNGAADVDVSVTYNCEPVDKAVTLEVFVRGTGEAEQMLGAKAAATCDSKRHEVVLTAAKIAESAPFTPSAGQNVRVFASLIGEGHESIEGGTAVRRLTIK
ncbi:hypothetical protein [Nocardia iowensis]|uniref:Uncharacterized protein n=1 Tax=Nocardia iowensis TaxID=204891 RepID=A0ABX8RV95_NOCIO|nr:hypothetical protein [Nocardia iowensis]QXN93569.1 hypothetical protein KV110_11100 [Nocardia iowensis]